MELLDKLFSPLIVLGAVLMVLLYRWITRNSRFFVDRNIPHKKPAFLFGSLRKMLLKQSSFNDVILELYRDFPEEKLTGVFELMNPITMVRDPELIKQIGVKDFQHFVNHRTAIPEESDPLFSRNLFFMRGDKWRDMRSTLSPAFTGSKMRSMFELVVNCSEDMKNILVERSEKEQLIVEMKDLFTRFANDVIATCAFGIQVNSLKDPENEFFVMGRDVTNFSGLRSLKFFGFINVPKLMKALGISLFQPAVTTFFRKVVMGNISYRDEHNFYRPDMIQLLREAKKGQISSSTEESVADSADTFAVVQEADVNKEHTTKTRRGG